MGFLGLTGRSSEAGSKPGRFRRWLRIALRVVGGALALLLLVLAFAYLQGRAALGRAPEGVRLERMMASPQWEGGVFRNPQPQRDDLSGALAELSEASAFTNPLEPISVTPIDPGRFETPPPSGLRITWFGHSTALIEIDGRLILTDPVWGPRASPLSWIGPRRWYEPVMALEELSEVELVVISHDHYDHLDYPTIRAMREWETTFLVPLGVGAHLEQWGIPADRIVELDWWERYSLGTIEIVSTPARHASGRHMFDRDRTLWAGYALLGPRHRVFFSGDTGMFPGVEEIGNRLGPFDITMIEVGAYARSWADWHMGPEQAVEAHTLLRGEVLLPIHWGMFNLAYHGWTEPMERVLLASEEAGVSVLTLRPGEGFEPGQPLEVRRWWPDLPWNTALEYPIVSSHIPPR